MCDQGREGTDSGWSSPAGGRLEPFPAAQTGQADTNKRASRVTDSHQNRCLINMQVRVAPGWQASLDDWPHCRTLVRTDLGTNNRPSGHPVEIIVPRSALQTLDSTPQMTAGTTRSWGRMGTGKMALASVSKIHDNASVYHSWTPGGKRCKPKLPEKQCPASLPRI